MAEWNPSPAAAVRDERYHIDNLLAGRHKDPFSFLGPHEVVGTNGAALAMRAFVPGTSKLWVVNGGQSTPMQQLHRDGVYEGRLSPRPLPFRDYKFRCMTPTGHEFELLDPYCYPPTLSDLDLHLLGEGTHYYNYERFGAHPRDVDGVKGVGFAVWAPNARRVSVVGDFNHWDGRRHPMRFHPGPGVWDIFIPQLQEGTHYKYEIVGPRDELLPLRTDPYGFRHEVRPRTASIVHDIKGFSWTDQEYLEKRRKQVNALDGPMSVYEVHLGSWMRDPAHPDRLLSYREMAEKLIPYVLEMGFTHIQLMPMGEFPYDGSWGYQSLGYFAPTSRFGEPADFMAFVDECHRNNLAVLLDWVPAHFPRDEHGFRWFDGTALYEHADPRQGEHTEWGTMIFNFGRFEVANFLIGSALFWLDKYHIDGLRVDAVASMLYLDYGRQPGEWVSNQYGNNHNLEAAEFLKRFNTIIHDRHPDVLTIAEESTSWAGVSRPVSQGGLGFSLKWNMGWMNDTLQYMHKEPIHRRFHQNDLTFSLVYAFHENFMLPLSHDEVVHGKGSLLDKMPGDSWQKFANLRLLFGYMWAHPGKKLLFMGGEFGQWQEWRFPHSLDWHLLQYEPHRGVQRWVHDLNKLMREQPALHELDFAWQGFEWIDFNDHNGSVLSFLRKGKDPADAVLFVGNFTPVVRDRYVVGVPRDGFYREILNSDAAVYGGSNVGNAGGVQAKPEPFTVQNRPFSISVKLPPLSIMAFRAPRD